MYFFLKKKVARIMVACVTGSVFTSKANFMHGANCKGGDGRKGLRESVCEALV
jgi:hypothetical protein